MMFLDCPAWLDEEGAIRCGLPAEVRHRFITRSTGGPLESAMIRCPAGHWFNGPIEFLTRESSDKHPQGLAGARAATGGYVHANAAFDDELAGCACWKRATTPTPSAGWPGSARWPGPGAWRWAPEPAR